MSSLRNAVARRPHKERSQPKAREKWGILEKHKDYSLRAKDYNAKKAKLAILSQKARDKNPDEFAYGMVRKSEGKHGQRDTENRLSHDAVKLLKSQDAGYLRTVETKGRRDLKRLEEVVGLKGGEGKKIVFEDGELNVVVRGVKRTSDGEVRQIPDPSMPQNEEDVSEEVSGNDVEEESTQPKQKTKKAMQAEAKAKLDIRTQRKRRKRLGELRAAKLEALKKRQREIMAAADQLELQRAKMAKTFGGVNKDGVKWKIRERKR